MKRILLFGGTTEGRQLAQRLDALAVDADIEVTLCLATEYGSLVLPELPHTHLHIGRLDEDAISAMLPGFCLVIDATHPYATLISKQLRCAAERAHTPYLRCLRAESALPQDCIVVDHAAEAAEYLAGTQGNILLTTGAKELSAFSNLEKSRLYARVLPSEESISICKAVGLAISHIIAMQGPFSKRLNLALMEELSICWLVTKDGGTPGGFEEKIAAARSCNAKVVLLRRPCHEQGLDVSAILQKLSLN